MKKLLFFIIYLGLVSSFALAEAPKLPRDLFSIDDIIKEFRGPLQIKIQELFKNYIVHKKGYHAGFSSHEDNSCLWANSPQGETLSKVELNIKRTESSLQEFATYTGCRSIKSLKELIVTTGTDLSPITSKQFFAGERSFELKDNEQTKLYRLSSGMDVELFRLNIRRTKNGQVAEFFIREQRFMNITYTFTEEQARAIYTFYNYDVQYKTKLMSWNPRRSRGTYALKVIVKKNAISPITYLSSQNNSISNSIFKRFFSFSVLRGTASQLAEFIKYHNRFFASTEFAGSGALNSRFLDELRLTFTRLLSSIDLNLVRNLIQDYIKAIEDGLLRVIDNRPKE